MKSLIQLTKEDIKNMPETTPCIRCGKLRIVAKTWSEKINDSLVTYTQTVCPDSECQSKVENELEKKSNKIKDIQQKSLERRKLNKRNKRQHSN